jgi:hypothetical protein
MKMIVMVEVSAFPPGGTARATRYGNSVELDMPNEEAAVGLAKVVLAEGVQLLMDAKYKDLDRARVLPGHRTPPAPVKYVRCSCGRALNWSDQRQVVPEPPPDSEWLTIGIVSCDHGVFTREGPDMIHALAPPLQRNARGSVGLSLDSFAGGVMTVYIEPLPDGAALVRVNGVRYYPIGEVSHGRPLG